MGIRNINYSYTKFAVIAIIVILSGANLQAYYGAQRNPTVANAIDFVNKNAKNGDLVIVFPNPGVFPYYSYRSDLKVITFPDNYSALWTKTTAQNMEELKVDTLGHPRVWLVTTQVAYTEALTKPVFDSMKQSYNLTLRGLNCSNNPDVRL
jgi:hypothetical protein